MQRWIDPFLHVALKTNLHIDGSVTGVSNVTLREIDRLAAKQFCSIRGTCSRQLFSKIL
jgi:hypothetical protein